MAKVIVPVIKLIHPKDAAFNLDVANIFQESGVATTDELTYTFRLSRTSLKERETISRKLQERLGKAQADRLIALLDEYDWDVSFFVDTF